MRELFFLQKQASPYTSHILQKISLSLYLSATKNLCSNLEHYFWFVTILNSLKTNILVRLKQFLL